MFKKVMVVAGFALLSGCGYQPLYQTNDLETLPQVDVASVQMIATDFNVGERRVAQQVGQDLRRFFTGADADALILEVNIEETTTDLAVRRDATVERSQITLIAVVRLTNGDGAEVFNTKIGSNAAYNVELTPYSTESSKVFARESAARTLSQSIIERVQHFLRFEQIKQEQPAKE